MNPFLAPLEWGAKKAIDSWLLLSGNGHGSVGTSPARGGFRGGVSDESANATSASQRSALWMTRGRAPPPLAASCCIPFPDFILIGLSPPLLPISTSCTGGKSPDNADLGLLLVMFYPEQNILHF